MQRESSRATARHAARRPHRPRWMVGAALLVAGCTGLFAAGGGYAQWGRTVALPQRVAIGSAHFAVGDPTSNSVPLPAPFSAEWSLPSGGLGDADRPLEPGGTFTHAVQMDGFSDGNRGMSAALAGVDIADPTGSGYLANRLELTAYLVPGADACVAAGPVPNPPLYVGPLAKAATPVRELVAPGAGGGSTSYLCLRFTLDANLVTSYSNTGSVTARVAGSADPSGELEVSASSQWHATVAPPDGAYQPQVTFRFSHETYREAT